MLLISAILMLAVILGLKSVELTLNYTPNAMD